MRLGLSFSLNFNYIYRAFNSWTERKRSVAHSTGGKSKRNAGKTGRTPLFNVCLVRTSKANWASTRIFSLRSRTVPSVMQWCGAVWQTHPQARLLQFSNATDTKRERKEKSEKLKFRSKIVKIKSFALAIEECASKVSPNYLRHRRDERWGELALWLASKQKATFLDATWFFTTSPTPSHRRVFGSLRPWRKRD